MGTRGAIAFVAEGTEKVVYNHYDSYPECLGQQMSYWLRTNAGRVDELKAAVVALQPVDSSRKPTPEELEHFAQFRDERVSEGDDWYALLRNTQGDPAAILLAGFYEDASSFPHDSLFCEWAYVVDFDEGVFEVYQGFQTSPPTEGRWVDLEGESYPGLDEQYFPVQRIARWAFGEIPADIASALATEEEDDDEFVTPDGIRGEFPEAEEV